MSFIVPKTLFHPIVNGTGPVETASYSWRLLRNCALDKLALDAIEAARAERGIDIDPALRACADPEIQLTVKLFTEGKDALSPHEAVLGAKPILDHILTFSQQALGKIMDRSGYLMNEAQFNTTMGAARRKIQDFLNEPKIGLTLKQQDICSLNAIADRTSLEDAEGPRSLYVSMDGWSASLIERRYTNPWTRVVLPDLQESPAL